MQVMAGGVGKHSQVETGFAVVSCAMPCAKGLLGAAKCHKIAV